MGFTPGGGISPDTGTVSGFEKDIKVEKIAQYFELPVDTEAVHISTGPLILASSNTAFDGGKLQVLYRNGYGYFELIKLLLISKLSGEKMIELIKLREKGSKVRNLAEKYKLDYKSILKESTQIHSQISGIKSE